MTWFWGAFLFLTGGAIGILVMALMAAAAEESWREAYLDARDRLWKLQRDSEGA